ncbi:unnamed protein product [Sphagnum balticum]
MGLPIRAVGLTREPLFAVAALAFHLLCQGIALRPPMGVHLGKFPMGTLAFVGQGCAIGIRQINHHNINIRFDTVIDAVFISGFTVGASHLHR